MKAPLRHAGRSPFLRVLACLAWLLLVAVPAHGESMIALSAHGMTVGMDMQDSSAHAPQSSAQSPAADCCHGNGEHGSVPGCHCAATFSTALAGVSKVVLMPVVPDLTRDATSSAAAPDGVYRPPLRPPST